MFRKLRFVISGNKKQPPIQYMKMKTASWAAIAALAVLPFTATAEEKVHVMNTNITLEEVEKAQQAWGAALISISKANKDKGVKEATAIANQVLDGAYGYNMGPVLFKPTLTVVPQTFRPTKEGALAYFVGGDEKFPNDTGFALKPWTKYEFENDSIHITADLALTMGKVRLTNDKGEVTEVDKTWGFKRDDSGTLRIVLHHSSLPYKP
jgi:hypothetical protein